MRGPALHPIVIAAGGTGGHLFPAEALASALIARGERIVLMTDARSDALDSQVFAGRERFVLKGAGIAGRSAVKATRGGFALLGGLAQARHALAALDARAIVAFGGYPSIPPVLAARMLKRRPRIVLHEQNAVLGRANRFLARRADALALSVADTTLVPHGVTTFLTGNPVRPAIQSIPAYSEPTDTRSILVLGGSLGARVLSDVVPAAIAALPEDARVRVSVVQQCRPEDLARVREAYARAGVAAELASFFPDVADRLAAAHLVIARAGASTVAELGAAGRPAILVPLPGAIDDHQSANAHALAAAGGALAFAQDRLTPGLLASELATLFSLPHRFVRMAEAARAWGRPDAADKLAELIDTLAPQEAPA